MKVSVIVPFLNNEPWIEQCLQALRGQDLPREEYEVIFVDNGYSDRSTEIVRRYPEIILLEEDRPGDYAARNTGLAVARGELLAFTNADCVPAGDWLRQVCDGMARTDAAMVLGTQRLAHRGPRVLQLCEDYDDAKAAYVFREGARHHVFAYLSNMAMRAEVVRALGPFAEGIRAGDIEYVQRYLGRFPRTQVAYHPDMVVTHLEITGLSQWLNKHVRYGRITRHVQRQTPYRPLGFKERNRIYWACVKTHHYTVWWGLCLLGVIAVGGLCFEIGRLRGCPEDGWGASR